MQYEWDETKRRANLRKHGIDFTDIPKMLEGDLVVLADDRYDYGEPRFMAFGFLSGHLVSVAYTERSENVIRLISARKASKHETKQYLHHITD